MNHLRRNRFEAMKERVGEGYPTSGTYATATISYPSSIDAITLSADVHYSDGCSGQPILAVMHGISGVSGDFDAATKERLARQYGSFFCVFVEMRGRGTSQGTADCGAREIQDIVDAVEYVKANYTAYVRPDRVYIVGYSGGGCNVLSAIGKFPDYWCAAAEFFGVVDYGYDAANGWYQNGAAQGHKDLMDTWIGGNPTTYPDRYHARSALLAVTNYSGGRLWIFQDDQDLFIPVAKNTDLVKAAFDAAGLGNYSSNVTTTTDSPRWQHGYPAPYDKPDLIQAEPIFMNALAGYQGWTIPASGTLKVAGYVDTKRFKLWFGDGTSEAGQVVYNTTTRTFTITSDSSPSDWTLTLKGQALSTAISATINGNNRTVTSDASGNAVYGSTVH